MGRGVASLIVAMVMGWLWLRLGKADWIRLPHRPDLDGVSKGRAFWAACATTSCTPAASSCWAPWRRRRSTCWCRSGGCRRLADNPVLSVLALAVLAVLLSICSEADAFVAASLSQFSLTSRLVFLVVGPMVDLKLISMQTGVFGRRFAARFAPGDVRRRRARRGRRGGGAAVNRQAQAVVLLLLGGAVLKASVTDMYLRYVKEGLRPFLIAAGVAAGRGGGDDADGTTSARTGRGPTITTHDDGHGRTTSPGSAGC